MAVAHDAASNYGASSTTVTSFSWTHTPSGTPRCAVVFVCDSGPFSGSPTVVTSVTYGGNSMTQLPYYARDGDTEIGNVTAWFLDNVPSGAQTVVVNRPSSNVQVTAGCVTMTAAGPCQIVSSRIVTQSGNGSVVTGGSSGVGGVSSSWSSIAVDDGSPGSNSQRYLSVYTGYATPPGAGTNTSTTGVQYDWGNYCWEVVRETTPSQGSKTLGVGVSISDDLAVMAFAVSEVAAAAARSFAVVIA